MVEGHLRTLVRIFLGFVLGLIVTVGSCITISYLINDGLTSTPKKNDTSLFEDVSSRLSNSGLSPGSPDLESSNLSNWIVDVNRGEESDFAFDAALFDMISRASLNQIVKLIQQWQNVEVSSIERQNSIAFAIVQRLAVIRPSFALEKIETFNWSNVEVLALEIFSVWLIADIRSAVKHASRADYQIKRAAITALVNVRTDLSRTKQLNIARELGMEVHFRAVHSAKLTSETTESFEDAWNTLVSDSVPNVVQQETLLRVANSWLEQNGVEVLIEVMGGYKGVEGDRYNIAQALLARYVGLNPTAAFEGASSLPMFDGGAFVALTVRSYALAEMEKVDPALAAKMLAENTELKDYERQYLWTSVISSWAESNPSELLASIDAVPVTLHSLVRQMAAVHLAGEDPDTAMLLLKSLPLGPTRFQVALSLANTWMTQDFEKTLDWVLSDPDIDDVRTILLGSVLPQLAIHDPYRAFDLALQHHLSNATGVSMQKSLQSVVLGTIVRENDFQVAIELLPRVHKESKLEAYREVSIALLVTSKGQEVTKLGSELSTSEQIQLYKDLISLWTSLDCDQFFETIRELPQAVRSKVAQSWMTLDPNPQLNSRQTRQLKRFAED